MIITSAQDIERHTRAGWWGTQTLHDLFCEAAAYAPEAIALVDPSNRREFTDGEPMRFNWIQVRQRVDQLCSAMLGAGLRYDDIVIVQLPTTHEYLLVYLACARLGIIPSPVPTQFRDHELRFIATHTRAKAFISMRRIGKTDHGALGLQLRAECTSLQYVMLFGDATPKNAVSLDSLMQYPADQDAIARHEAANPVSANDIATIIWTSGTESRPKAVPRTHNQWLVSRHMMSDAADLARGCHLLSPRMLCTVGGISGSVITWLDRAARLVLHQPINLDLFMQQVRDEEIDFTSAPPAVLHDMLKHEELLPSLGASRLRYISSGSAALSDWVVSRFRERHGIEVLNFYGSSEGASLASTARDIPDPSARTRYFPRYGSPNCRSTQISARFVETRLINPATGEVIEQSDVTGELCFRGPNVCSGYYGLPELTARTFDDDGFYRTGDLFRIAGEHQELLEFVGRAKDIIVRGGVNISAEEIESLLSAHPSIDSVAVIGYPDSKLGEKVCAVVVASNGAAPTLESLCLYLIEQKQIAIYKLPQRLMLIETLPRSPAGKVLKATLRQMAQHGSEGTD